MLINVDERLNTINRTLLKMQRDYEKLPDGKLIRSQNGANVKWYVSNGKEKWYIPSKNRMLAEKLAYKKYLELKMNCLTIEKHKLETNFNANIRVSERLNTFLADQAYTDLIKNYLLPEDITAQSWMNEKYPKSTKKPEQLKHDTINGLMVRSKAESLIAISLHEAGIRFRYECLLPLGNSEYYPDFTLIKPNTGRIMYWEHFGMMDAAGYVNDFHNKVPWLAQNGLIIGKNLIASFETNDQPLTYGDIHRLINFYLLS